MTDTDKNCPHCGVHIDEHEASPCLNAWVAADVMGIDSIRRHDLRGPGRTIEAYAAYSDDSEDGYAMYWFDGDFYDYSGQIAPAWEVVEKLQEDDFWLRLVYKTAIFLGDLNKAGWSACFRCVQGGIRGDHLGVSVAPPLAICRAAIKASPRSQDRIDPDPRLEEIAKAAAEINPDFTFDDFVDKIIQSHQKLKEMTERAVNWSPLNIADALEKHAKALDKTRDELDDTEKMQAMVNAVLAQGERLMPKSILYKMYAADTIKLVKATLQGTTTPMVPFKVDPLEFCHEAHKVKDELVSNAMELLENDIPMKQDDGWINIEKSAPEEGQKVLVWIKASVPIGGETEFAFILVYEGGITNTFNMGGEVARATHWMPLPDPPSVVKGENDDE